MMARSPVTSMVEQYKALTEVEQKVFLDLVDPQPEPEAPAKQKRTRKKKAEAPAAQKRGLPTSSGVQRCVFMDSDQFACDLSEDNPVHDPKGGYGGYHPFSPSASSAARISRRRGATTNLGVSTEGEKETALSASSGGD